MFDADGLIRLGGPSRGLPSSRLQAGLLVDTQDHFVRPEPTRIEIAHCSGQLREGDIARHLGRQPHLMTPRFQSVMGQNLPHTFNRDRPHNLRVDQLSTDLNAVPLRQRTARRVRTQTCNRVGTFASDLHRVYRHLRGKKPAGDRSEVGHSDRAIGPAKTDDTNAEQSAPSHRSGEPSPPMSSHQPPPESSAPDAPTPLTSTNNAATAPTPLAPLRSTQSSTPFCDHASEPPCSG